MNKMQPIIPTSKQLVRNSVSGVIRSIILVVVFFIVYPIYINILGTEMFGVWVMVSVIIGWSQLGSLGIPQTIMKFVAGSAAKGDKEELVEYISSALAIILFSGIVIMLILFFIKGVLGNFLRVPPVIKPKMPFFIFFAALVVVISFLAQSINSILSGIGRTDLANINEIVGKILGVIISVILIFKGYGIWGLLFGSMANFLIILIFACILGILILGFVPYNIKLIKKKRIKETISFGGTLTAGSLCAMFLEPFNRFVLGQYVALSAATVYDVASRIVIQIRSVLEVAFRPITPQSSTYFNIGKLEEIKELSKFSVSLICLLGAPIFLTLIIWAPELINIWLKIEVQNISYAIRIIAIAYIFSLMVTPAYYLFMGIGKKEKCFWVYFILSALNFTLVLLCLFLGFINLKWVVNIFALSLIFSSLYLMRASYKEFGERYLADIKNLAFISLSIICISFFKFIGLAFNFQGMFNILLIFVSFLIYLAICYMSNLIPVDKIRSHLKMKEKSNVKMA